MKEQTIEIPLTTYIDMLDERRRFIDETYGWSIPMEVYDYFVQLLEDGYKPDPSRSAPSYVIDNIALNRDYGPVEEYDVFGEMAKRYTQRKLKRMRMSELRQLFEECDNGEALLCYEDSNSEYGLGVCYSL